MVIDENQNQDTPPSGDPGQENQNDYGEDPENQGGDPDLAERGKGSNRGLAERIDALTSKNDKLEKEVRDLRSQRVVPNPPAPANPNVTAAKTRAVEYLKSLGFSPTEDVDTKIQQIEDRMTLNNEHMRLMSEYDGADGRPRYDRNKVESFMRDHAVYDPEVAYKALYEAELLDWSIKKGQSERKQRPYIERGGGSSRNAVEDNTITREKIDEWMKTPEGRAKYEQNREKILDMMTKGQL
jgi:hypothetical protein